MTQPLPPQPPPQAYWFPAVPPRSTTPQSFIIILVVLVGAVTIIPVLIGGVTGNIFPGVFTLFLCVPFLFVLIAVLAILVSSSSQRRIPPPPPIQQPMVPAGQQGPVALDCPNCGGPPTNVDRFGIATCAYCGTRFLVR